MRVETPDIGTIELGATETSPTIGIIDYSRRVTDDYGVTTVVERGFARRMSVRLGVPTDGVAAVQRQLAELRATAATWIADDSLASLTVTGFYKDFELDHAVPPLSYCTLTVEGLALTEGLADSGADPAPDGEASTLLNLQPVTISDAGLIASNITENDHPAWAAGTTYDVGARVIKMSTHRIYESAAAANIGNDPAGDGGKWLDVGPTSRWAMFDQALGTASSAPESIVVTLDAGSAQAVALLDVVASTVRVQVPGYDHTVPVGAGAVTFLDLPGTDAPVTVTITGPGTVSVGTLLIGSLVGLGITEASPTAGITDFSRKVVDDFGEVTIVERAWAKRMTARALIATTGVDDVFSRIAAVRARPTLWIGQSGLDSLTIYGFFKDFSIEVAANVSKVSLSIEGLSTAAPKSPGLPAAFVPWTGVTNSDPVNHPRPADGATNSADPASPFGPERTVGGIIGDLEAVTAAAEVLLADLTTATSQLQMQLINFLKTSMLMETQRQRSDAHGYIEGINFGTVVREDRQARIDGDEAIVTDMSLLGAKSGDGTAWILDLATVKVSPTSSVGERFSEIDAAITTVDSTVAANYTELTQAVADEAGARATLGTLLTAAIDGVADDLTASVGTLESAIATAEAATATLGTTVNARIDGVESSIAASVATLSTAIAAAESATASLGSAVNTRFGTVEASVTSLASTVSSGDAANASAITSLGATVSGLSGTVTSISGALATIGGRVAAWWNVSLGVGADSSADAFVTLRAETSPGIVSSYVALGAREVHILNEVDGSWKKALSIVGGKVKASDVEVDTLKVNTAMVPVRSTATAEIGGSYPSTSFNIPADYAVVQMSVVVVMTVPGYIDITAGAKQDFTDPGTNSSWVICLDVDGSILAESVGYGQYPQDYVSILGSFYASAAGSYTVSLRWQAEGSVVLRNRYIRVNGAPFTE